jgi:ABC-type antimicrobial peptide transport system, permease component
MIMHIVKIIFKNWKANGWIFAELLLVVGAVWYMADKYYVDTRTYFSPLGYDISNVWFFRLDNLNESNPDYVSDSDPVADLAKLREQIVRHDLVEEACISYFSSPYSYGNSWNNLYSVDADTTVSNQRSFHVRRVTPEYFDVFRITDNYGNRITPNIAGHEQPVVISVDMEKIFFTDGKGIGKKVRNDNSEAEEYPIIAVCIPIRDNDYEKSEPCYFHCLTGSNFVKYVQRFGNTNAELTVRMKTKMSQEEMNKLLSEMGDMLTVNNLYVFNAKEIAEQREEILFEKQSEEKSNHAVVAFVLVNVFFGIIGTFWLRTQSRREEIGLRIALGASKKKTKQFLYTEGLCLLALTVPFMLVFIANMFYFDVPDTFRIPVSFTRLLITFGGTYLLIGGMIILGISLPARKAAQMQPAEALHYE